MKFNYRAGHWMLCVPIYALDKHYKCLHSYFHINPIKYCMYKTFHDIAHFPLIVPHYSQCIYLLKHQVELRYHHCTPRRTCIECVCVRTNVKKTLMTGLSSHLIVSLSPLCPSFLHAWHACRVILRPKSQPWVRCLLSSSHCICSLCSVPNKSLSTYFLCIRVMIIQTGLDTRPV